MRVLTLTILIGIFAPLFDAQAQENRLSAHSRFTFGAVQKILLAAAEKMPEESYGFKPADSVRTFGQIVGHVADSQYGFCSSILGEKNPAPKIEKNKTSKAELVAALEEAFTYCNRASDALTDATAVELVKTMGREMPKLGVLHINQMHTMEHYGNLITYMRMKDIVPPSSDPAFMKSLSSK